MTANCEVCGVPYEKRNARSRFCGDTCQKRSRRVGGQSSDVPSDSGLVAAVSAELDAAGQLGTVLGQAALNLARQLTTNKVAIGVAAMNKELRSTMLEALQGAAVSDDAVDELRMKRDLKRRAG